MDNRVLRFLATLPLFFLVNCQTTITPATGVEGWSSDEKFFNVLQEQESKSNGIEVGEPKIYDDATLRLMLEAAEDRLAAINSFNEAALTTRLGAVTGSRIDQTQVGLQVTGSPVPQTVTTNTGATTQTTTNADGTIATIATAPKQDIQTTATTMAPPPSPTIPAGLGFTAPTGMSVSAVDTLNEELQLDFKIAGLRLTLSGSNSDRFAQNQRLIKPRATIGFPITIKPQARYKNAVAVVEVEVTTADHPIAKEPPTITALFPQEETHNVAGLTDRTTSIGAGAIVGTVGVAGSFLRARRTFYLVQDQDTVALLRSPDPANKDRSRATAFAWEFRPVLGQEFVRGGMKQVFVQLAFPLLDQDCLGSIRVRTYWRHFDQKTGLTKGVVEGSVLKRDQLFSVPKYDLRPFVEEAGYQDIGEGNVLVNVKGSGSFLEGTYVQLGPTRYDALNGLRMDETGLTFVAPAAALARWTGQVVSRSGEKSDLLNVAVQKKSPALDQLACIGKPVKQKDPSEEHCERIGSISINKISLTPLNENETQVSVDLTSTVITKGDFDGVLLEIGGKVFGLSDTLVSRRFANNAGSIIAVVPTSLLVKGQRVRAFRPFWSAPDGEQATDPRSECFNRTADLPGFGLDSAVERLVLVAADKEGATYLLYGNGLKDAVIIQDGKKSQGNSTGAQDESIELKAVGDLPEDRVRLLRITNDKLSTLKKLVLQKGAKERPLVLDVPKPETKPAEPPKVTLDSPVVQNTDELDVSVERAGDLKSVKIGSKVLRFAPGKDSIRLTNLRGDGVTSEQKVQELIFKFNDETEVKVKLEVVAARVGVTGGLTNK